MQTNAQRLLATAVWGAFRDNGMTYDSMARMMPNDSQGNAVGQRFAQSYQTHDGRTVDSSGAFFVGELERLDQELHMPLTDVSWFRDVRLRTDVTIADEVSSFTLSTFASAGGLGAGSGIGNGKAWANQVTNQATGIAVDIAKIPHPLTVWLMEMKYSIPELESSARVGRPIDTQKFEGVKLKHQMDIDEQVYIGDTTLGLYGLLNSDLVTNVSNAINGASGSPLWTQKTADEILNDVNTWITSVWAASGWAVMPKSLRIPPNQFGYISTQKVSNAGNMSILKYIKENSILTTTGNGELDIKPLKWCIGAGAGGTVGTSAGHDRAVVYTNDFKRVRFPLTELQRTPVQYDSIYHKTSYFCRLGAIEVVYPETLGYFDGF